MGLPGNFHGWAAPVACSRRWSRSSHWVDLPDRSRPSSTTKSPRWLSGEEGVMRGLLTTMRRGTESDGRCRDERGSDASVQVASSRSPPGLAAAARGGCREAAGRRPSPASLPRKDLVAEHPHWRCWRRLPAQLPLAASSWHATCRRRVCRRRRGPSQSRQQIRTRAHFGRSPPAGPPHRPFLNLSPVRPSRHPCSPFHSRNPTRPAAISSKSWSVGCSDSRLTLH